MIFVTVGHQMPFDRMLGLIDRWSSLNHRSDIVAQIGDSEFTSTNFETTQWMSPSDYLAYVDGCSAIVSHAGTGTIIQVLMRKKPMLVLPRLSHLAETRNDHQIGTARYFEERGLLKAAYDDDSFISAMQEVESFSPTEQITGVASEQLLNRISGFVNAVS